MALWCGMEGRGVGGAAGVRFGSCLERFVEGRGLTQVRLAELTSKVEMPLSMLRSVPKRCATTIAGMQNQTLSPRAAHLAGRGREQVLALGAALISVALWASAFAALRA
jgi:hypothetical protein